MREPELVVLTDLEQQPATVTDAELVELLRDAEVGAWIRTESNGDGTWTVYTGLARGGQWPDPDEFPTIAGALK
jgi:hypothetical protein